LYLFNRRGWSNEEACLEHLKQFVNAVRSLAEDGVQEHLLFLDGLSSQPTSPVLPLRTLPTCYSPSITTWVRLSKKFFVTSTNSLRGSCVNIGSFIMSTRPSQLKLYVWCCCSGSQAWEILINHKNLIPSSFTSTGTLEFKSSLEQSDLHWLKN